MSQVVIANSSEMPPTNCSDGDGCNTTVEDFTAQLNKINDEKAVHYIPVMIWIVMLMLVGVVGNSLVIYVYRRRFKKTSSNYFILTMALFDLIACVVGLPTEIYDLRYPYTFYSPAGCKIFRFTETFVIYGSTIVLVEIAFDRFFKICRPLMLISLFKIKLSCIFAAIFALLLSIPSSILYGITRSKTAIQGLRTFDCSIEHKYVKTTFQMLYYIILLVVFMLTLLILTVLYIRIWLEIRRRRQMIIGDHVNKPRLESEANEKKKARIKYVPSTSDGDGDDDSCNNGATATTACNGQAKRSRLESFASYAAKLKVSRTTVILFAVTVAFVISYLPSIVVMVLRSTIKNLEADQSIAGDVTSKLFSKFYFINNAINPIIYSFLNINFRRQAKATIHKVLCFDRRRRYRCPQKCDSDRSTKKEMIIMDG
ncbi:orexin receptor type 2-like [Gigantopelta aegis]|uniref:orexin receptor type 2-like n=1 Tax=Gigantopelta aegis TaxID=1735272 RepID=UPI001B889609|nr:orexin receptor type 2-like [Gigantopelta aegis]